MAKPHFYQAIGELQATLVVAADGQNFLDTVEAQYRVWVPEKVSKKYQDNYQGQLVFWRVYPLFKEDKWVFQTTTFTPNEPRYGHGQFILQGDWISEKGQLQVCRNANPGKTTRFNWKPRLLPISWADAPEPEPEKTFWQVKAELIEGMLKVVEATGPFAHPPRLEKYSDFWGTQQGERQQETQQQPKLPKQPKQQAATNPETINWKEITPVSGKLELTIKINALPQMQQALGKCHFKVDCDGRVFQVSVKPKMWAKLETAHANYPQWVAALAGKLGAATSDGFVLEEPSIQVFEKKSFSSEAVPQEPLAASDAKITQVKTSAEPFASPQEKPDTQLQPSTLKSKPKRIGKMNVEIR